MDEFSRPPPASDYVIGRDTKERARFRLNGCVLSVCAVDVVERSRTGCQDIIGEFNLSGQKFLILRVAEASRDLGNALDRLTARELQIARLIAHGKPTKCIAHDLRISEWTVLSYIQRIFSKLGVNSRAAMVYRCAALFTNQGTGEMP